MVPVSEDLSDFDRLLTVVSRTFRSCSWSALVSAQETSTEEEPINWWHGSRFPQSSSMYWLIPQESYRSTSTVCGAVWTQTGPMLIPVHCWKRLIWAREHQNWITEQYIKVAQWTMVSFPIMWTAMRRLPGEEMTRGCTMFCWVPSLKTKYPTTWKCRNGSGMAWGTQQQFKVCTWPPSSPDLNPAERLWDVTDKRVRSMEAPPHRLQDLKDLLLTSWRRRPQHIFRGLIVPQKKGDLHNIVADLCFVALKEQYIVYNSIVDAFWFFR